MISIRQEIPKDYIEVEQLIQGAFENLEMSDKTEHHLVNRLRKSDAFIPELSLVAVHDYNVVGHILLSKITIIDSNQIHSSLALAPVSVMPEFQGRGIGSALIRQSHIIAKQLNYHSIILIGHENYYPRFGYEKCSLYHIKFPFEAPDENCMVHELIAGKLKNISGTVKYPDVFFDGAE